MSTTMKPIRLIVADIDGCISRGSSSAYSPHVIERMIEVNNRSRSDETVPPITFCTGRPQPYVECLMQVTHAYMPALCEAGIVLFDPETHAVRIHPGFGREEQQAYEELRRQIEERLVSEQVMFEPGKITHHTMLITPPLRPEDFVEEAREIAGQFNDLIEVETTKVCVHFLFRHLHKGSGVEWLAEYTGIGMDEMAGIGDARPDLPFLKKVAISCAPSEAHNDVKDVCTLVSGKCDADAMIELLDHCIAHNEDAVQAEGTNG